MIKDHPIFLESINFIRSRLSDHHFNALESHVLERLIHTSGDFAVKDLLRFSKDACLKAREALLSGAPILTDTDMAAIAIKSMAKKTNGNLIFSAKKWIVENQVYSSTKSAYGMEKAWMELSSIYHGLKSPIVIFGSAPTALEKLLDILDDSNQVPSLIVGMPVGFIGVEKCKTRLIDSPYTYIVLDSTRGGAAMAASVINALLRSTV